MILHAMEIKNKQKYLLPYEKQTSERQDHNIIIKGSIQQQ